MSISVIATSTVSSASSAGLSTLSAIPTADGGQTIDFAALLSNFSQMADSISTLKPAIDKENKRSLDALSAQDPAQSPQNLLINITPAIENRALIDVDRNSLSAADSRNTITAINDEAGKRNTSGESSLLDQLTNRSANFRLTADAEVEKTSMQGRNSHSSDDLLPNAEAKTNSNQGHNTLSSDDLLPNVEAKTNSKQGRNTLSSDDLLPSAPPIMTPAIENCAQIAVDRNRLPAATQSVSQILGGLDANSHKSAAININLSAKDLESESTLSSPPPTGLNVTSKSEASLTQSNQPALSSVTPTASTITAILAGETNSGNASPNTFATVMANHTAQTQQAQHPAPNTNPSVTTPLQDNRWAQDFSERIVWVARNDQQVAQINISPAQLGPVQITLNMNGDQASIAFASPHAEVRKAIEDAMPNLREMLSTAGISLGQSNVGAQLQQQQRDTAPLFTNGNRSAGETAILPADSRSGSLSTGLPIQRGRGLVDLFA